MALGCPGVACLLTTQHAWHGPHLEDPLLTFRVIRTDEA